MKMPAVPDVIIDDFFSKSSSISQKAQQQGLQYALEEYVHNILVSDNKIEAKVYRSQKKHEKPHLLVIKFVGESITGQECSCIAG